ncbi:hypothetical protein COU74_03205 [Candidatus Peregrinibacteria bacterium CG10_big_fil_rev_8_21_14_0_10_36_19]|nr:MAG: hypothetical protein COU74_03205 [Candidatus Peregrinibacteria bacterium CG10_big_fil_rev_8_21_14_0_10_36_19]
MDLNESQNQAVNHVEGPLLIIAGAGTGKTRVITSRILQLISTGKARTTEILALTFTEKAASEMAERIDEGMPLSYEEICVKTFHGFCDGILRESGSEIGLDPGYKLLDDVEKWLFFKKNLFKFELNYYRPLGNPNSFINDLLKHFGRLKEELIEPDEYIEYAKKLDGEEGEKTLELANAYKKYFEVMIEKNYLDFSDLIFYTLRLFSRRESVLKKYRERFKFVMVDEFQDTNYSQYALVKMITAESENLVVVGDDDQSIYKWRGASLSNILQFENDFKNLKKVVLTDNYRSCQEVLDASYSLIQNNNPDRLESRSGISKKLRATRDESGCVECHSFPTYLEEANFVAEQIKELHEKGVNYGSMAILSRSNQHVHPIIDALKPLNIPYQVKDSKGILMLEEIKDLVSVARALANPYDDISVLRILKMDVFAVPMSDILKLLNSGSNTHIINALRKGVDVDNLSIPGTEEGIKKISDLLEHLIEFSKKSSIGEVFNEFLRESGYLDYMVEKDMFEEMYHVNQFAKQVSRFEKDHEEKSVIDFVEYLNLLEESNSVMASDFNYDRDSVQILSVHSSKGLEFDAVFVISAVDHRFPGTNRSEKFEIPVELSKEIVPEGDVHRQEERRLFYVAITRARSNLYITMSKKYEGNKVWKVSPFVKEILEVDGVKMIEHEESIDVVDNLRKFKKPAEPIFELPKYNLSRLSHSKIETFNTCPLKFNYQYLLNIPVSQGHAANFGNSIHGTLHDFYKVLKSSQAVSIELMKELYEKNWLPHGYDSLEHAAERKKKGWEQLEEFYKTNSDPWIKPAYLERPFSIKLNDNWFTGRVDRIDKLSDGTYEVIDYKTGRLKDDLKLKGNTQLALYVIAAQEVFNLRVSKASLYYLEDNKKISISVEELDVPKARVKILETVSKIRESDFAPTPGFPCSFCDFRLICPAA